jgi:chromate transport protein ChrA
MNKAKIIEVFLSFLRLGLTSFGGPVAHLSYFRTEFVGRRKWLGEAAYADLVALCQFLPGPASSQTGIALGYFHAGFAGASPPGSASPCPRRWRWSPSPMASERWPTSPISPGCMD